MKVIAEFNLTRCNCGGSAKLISYYTKGTPNRLHHFVRCETCRTRTKDRKKANEACREWNLMQKQMRKEN